MEYLSGLPEYEKKIAPSVEEIIKKRANKWSTLAEIRSAHALCVNCSKLEVFHDQIVRVLIENIMGDWDEVVSWIISYVDVNEISLNDPAMEAIIFRGCRPLQEADMSVI